MIPFPFKPQQSGHAITFTDGILSIALDGGMPRQRLDVEGAPDEVTASWVLYGEQYDLFNAAMRNWRRSGGEPLLMQLVHDTFHPQTYQVLVVPKSRRATKVGNVFTVSANLLVKPLAKYLDPDQDLDATRAYLIGVYGSEILAQYALDLLKQMMTQEMPHE